MKKLIGFVASLTLFVCVALSDSALLFNGLDSRVRCEGATSTKLDNLPNSSNGFTAAWWLYKTGDGTGVATYDLLVEKATNAANTGFSMALLKSTASPANALSYYEFVKARQRVTAANVITANNVWHFVAVTVLSGNAASDVHWYTALPGASGVAEPSYSTTTNGVAAYVSDAAQHLAVGNGSSAVGNNFGFKGRKAELRIFDKALNINELNGVFRNQKMLNQIFHFPMYALVDPEKDLSSGSISCTLAVGGDPAPTLDKHAPVGP